VDCIAEKFYSSDGSHGTRGDHCPFIKFINPTALNEKTNNNSSKQHKTKEKPKPTSKKL